MISSKNNDDSPNLIGRASGASDINEENSPSEFSNKFNLQGSGSKSKTKKDIDESNASANGSKSARLSPYSENEKSQEENESEESSSNHEDQLDSKSPNYSSAKDDLLFEIDIETRDECIKMLKYHRPSSPNKSYQKLERYLPKFIELDTPIPEELALDYEFAKYDISNSISIPKETTEKYKEALIKYETLSCYMYHKSEFYRLTNERLVERIEINLFPLILENSLLTLKQNQPTKEFIISVKGWKRKKFWHNTIPKNFERHKSELLLGSIDKDGNFTIPEDLNSSA